MKTTRHTPYFVLLLLVFSPLAFCETASGQVSEFPSNSVHDQLETNDADWPWWRGPNRDGIAFDHPDLPREWDAESNVRWHVEIPGRGHGAPIAVGKFLYLPTCIEEEGSQSLMCLDRASGEVQWTTVVHSEGAMSKNQKASAASGTAACDGETLFVNFANSGAAYTTAISLNGEVKWQSKICDYIVHQGYGSSPTLYQDMVIVSADNKSGGAVVAMERVSGDVIWKRDRPKLPNYSSPVILHVDGRDQLIMTGCDQVVSYDPLSGETLWEMEGATTECVTTTVTDGMLVYSSGGYPKNHLAAIRADGSKEVVWETNDRVYVPSLLIHNGHLYGVLDAGVAACWKCDTGELKWKSRLDGAFSASPVLVGDLIYATNEEGVTFVYRAKPDEFELLHTNSLGDETFATPTICNGEIFLRVGFWRDDRRQEYLYCIGK